MPSPEKAKTGRLGKYNILIFTSIWTKYRTTIGIGLDVIGTSAGNKYLNIASMTIDLETSSCISIETSMTTSISIKVSRICIRVIPFHF